MFTINRLYKSDKSIYFHQKSSAALYKNQTSHTHFFCSLAFSGTCHVRASNRRFGCAMLEELASDVVCHFICRCCWFWSIDSYKYIRNASLLSLMSQPSLYRISPLHISSCNIPCFDLTPYFFNWFKINRNTRNDETKGHGLTMFSLSQESYHLVPTQKAPGVRGGSFPWVTLMCLQHGFKIQVLPSDLFGRFNQDLWKGVKWPLFAWSKGHLEEAGCVFFCWNSWACVFSQGHVNLMVVILKKMLFCWCLAKSVTTQTSASILIRIHICSYPSDMKKLWKKSAEKIHLKIWWFSKSPPIRLNNICRSTERRVGVMGISLG